MKIIMLFLFGATLALPTVGVLGQERVRSLMTIPGDAQITLTWLPAPGASGYNVKQGASVIATNVPGSSYVVTNLRNRVTYDFAVSSVADEFESADTPRLRATPSAAVLDLLPAGAKVEKLATGFQYTEGPVWSPAEGGFLIFSDIYGNRLLRWTPGSGVTTFRSPSQRANGNTRDLQGRLITCQSTTRSVTRTESDGTVTPLVTEFKGKPFNEPNDVVVKSDGTVWFTDPIAGNSQTQPGQYVYRFDPEVGNVSVTLVATNIARPNGIAFSPDEKQLYVADWALAGVIYVFDVLPGNTLANRRLFCQAPYPDGIRADRRGRILVTSNPDNGIRVFGADGQLLGTLPTPELPLNLCFGGTNQEMLFITTQTSLYGITRMPDLVVTAIYTVPAGPTEGQRVTFSAVVSNKGTGPTPADQAIRLSFWLDGVTDVFWSTALTQTIPPDASVLFTANAGASGPFWKATAGSHYLQATVDDLNQLPESNEMNNTLKVNVAVAGVPSTPADSDGDGLDDASETAAGTDPGDRSSVLKIMSVKLVDADRLALTWSSVPGKNYRVCRRIGADNSEWAGSLSTVTATGTVTSAMTTVIKTNNPSFYRVQVP